MTDSMSQARPQQWGRVFHGASTERRERAARCGVPQGRGGPSLPTEDALAGRRGRPRAEPWVSVRQRLGDRLGCGNVLPRPRGLAGPGGDRPGDAAGRTARLRSSKTAPVPVDRRPTGSPQLRVGPTPGNRGLDLAGSAETLDGIRRNPAEFDRPAREPASHCRGFDRRESGLPKSDLWVACTADRV